MARFKAMSRNSARNFLNGLISDEPRGLVNPAASVEDRSPIQELQGCLYSYLPEGVRVLHDLIKG
jgi:hypothetical protein